LAYDAHGEDLILIAGGSITDEDVPSLSSDTGNVQIVAGSFHNDSVDSNGQLVLTPYPSGQVGNIDLSPAAIISAPNGGVSITTPNGSISAPNSAISAGNGLALSATGPVTFAHATALGGSLNIVETSSAPLDSNKISMAHGLNVVQ